ncbi:MAG TPA: Asp-tRNA(Asn)/Glu-tRNA(Gln) amidotransferase subunit GatB [Euryarchaeota archaeon]|nr:aspartyl/glutamyl-tRNA(Asn/Gln) amidotransferase subunit B [archaeon BMS3Abin16]HDH28975.1 Asp-tRNA(Asn)/Glu-tRNA(Gln) amidotransferase subunit GatB [Euryarchaeota archaeon]
MKTIIGFEIHEQIATKTKLYCDSPTDYRDAAPNTNVCEVCTGMPGSKPHPVNQEAIDAAVEIALMLDCEIVKDPIYIQRKHYDYPDLPSGYQRTSLPIGKNGSLGGIGIWEVHLEEDPGKYEPKSGKVDYNRSGVPLVEIVTAPDITNPEDGRRFLRELVKVLQYTGKVKTEGGTMRTDTNISLEGGARVEIKNINSVKGAYKALKFEITRQKNLRKRGHAVKRETRAFVEAQMITKAMRTKEEADDYRYIPDPDIPPLLITDSKIAEIKSKMPETPQMKEKRFASEYGIKLGDANVLASELELANAFEKVAKEVEADHAARWIVRDLKRVLEYNSLTFKGSSITTEQLVELFNMIKSHEITVKTGQKVIEMLAERPHSPRKIVEELGLGKIKEDHVVEEAVKDALAENQKAVDDYTRGNPGALNYVVGQVMRKTKGRADPSTVLKMLKEQIK